MANSLKKPFDTEKECLAVVWSTVLFRTLLLGHHFVLQTDHSALKQLLTNKTATGRLARWAMKLQEFGMTVFHRKGEDQGNAGFLSRLIQNPDGTFTVNWFQSGGISTGDAKGKHTALHFFHPTNQMNKNAARIRLVMNDSTQVPRSHTVVPKIPNLISKLHPHYESIESIARVEHRQVNDWFLDTLRKEQASDPWINKIKRSLQYNDNTYPSTQKWVNNNMIVEINGIKMRCAEK